MDWIEVPDFGIKKFKTVKNFTSMEFRPSATSLELDKAIIAMRKERSEQEDMINSKNHVNIVCQSDKLIAPKIKPAEAISDTMWFQGSQNPRTTFFAVKDYSGNIDYQNKILLPIDISLYSETFDLYDKKSLHWATSGGFANDTSQNIAIAKGMSELIENHLKMYWWFNATPLYLINVDEKNILLNVLNNQLLVQKTRLFLLDLPSKVGSYVAMCVLETKSFPYVSIGFGAHHNLNASVNHAICESVHYYRGANWYKLMGESEKIYTSKNKEILSLINKTANSKLNSFLDFDEINIDSITRKFSFFAKTIYSNAIGTTTKVFSTDLQPLVNSVYVPFFDNKLVRNKNINKRQKYKGVPFI